MSGSVKNDVINFMVDSAADISVIPLKFVAHLPLQKLDSPFQVEGFNGEICAKVDHRVDLEVKFVPGRLKTSFYVCDAIMPIIGTDLLRNKDLRLSLETGTNVFKVGNIVLKLKPTPKAAEKEYYRRQNMGGMAY